MAVKFVTLMSAVNNIWVRDAVLPVACQELPDRIYRKSKERIILQYVEEFLLLMYISAKMK